ncbi:MAG: STAS domain-containing protein [Treponema sp.]|nr:STAS domain-containing protein [Treponema sp.]
MNIETTKIDPSTVVLSLIGRLDTVNSSLLERKIKQLGEGIAKLIINMEELEYISSMGIRVLLHTHKSMTEKNNKLIIKNMCQNVREVFEITGFLNYMVQEEKFIVIRKDEAESITLYFNGEMQSENVQDVLKELQKIRKQKETINEAAKIIFDWEKLAAALPGSLKYLKRAIAETEWQGRTLCIRNIPIIIKNELEYEGFGDLVMQE